MRRSADCPPSSWWSLWPTLDSPRAGGWREAEGSGLSPAAAALGRWMRLLTDRGVRTRGGTARDGAPEPWEAGVSRLLQMEARSMGSW